MTCRAAVAANCAVCPDEIMITTEKITEENKQEYEALIPPDEAENIGRAFYKGLAARGDDSGELQGALIWELKHAEKDGVENEVHLSFVTATDTGRALFDGFKEAATEAKAVRSTVELPAGEGKEKRDLLSGEHFSFREKEAEELVVTIGDLASTKIAKKSALPPFVKPLGMLMQRTFRRGIMNCIFHAKRDLLEDLATLPLKWYEPAVSCYVETDGKPNAFLLVHKTASGNLRIEMLAGFGADIRTNLLYLIRFSAMKAVETYPPETRIILPRRDDAARQLVSKVFPKRMGKQVLFGVREEVASDD